MVLLKNCQSSPVHLFVYINKLFLKYWPSILWLCEAHLFSFVFIESLAFSFLPPTLLSYNWYINWKWFPGQHSCKESACQYKRHRLDPWTGKIPWSRKRQPTPVSLPGKFYRQRSQVGYSLWDQKELHTTEGLSTSLKWAVCWFETNISQYDYRHCVS